MQTTYNIVTLAMHNRSIICAFSSGLFFLHPLTSIQMVLATLGIKIAFVSRKILPMTTVYGVHPPVEILDIIVMLLNCKQFISALHMPINRLYT